MDSGQRGSTACATIGGRASRHERRTPGAVGRA
jgi:hypothetical protein